MITDVLVVGAGAAGLRAALALADRYSVLLVSKDQLESSATYYAQGGIAAVIDNSDSLDSHISDTLEAGAGLCSKPIVELVVGQAPKEIASLIDMGVDFDSHAEGLDLTREGGHSHNRVLHVLDRTGKAISKALTKQASKHPNITIVKNLIIIDLINQADHGSSENKIVGAYAYNNKTREYITISSRATILATGGASKAYLYSNSIQGASGDGIAMAWRAGAVVANLEFNQFHPTYLYHAHSTGMLLSEALRGEGARLLLPDGSPFAAKFDKRAELAPRDVVARAIDYEMKRLGLDCVYLDISHKSGEWIKERFPHIYKSCKRLNIDITRQPIPVVPAAHYTCGGVLTNEDGQTNINGLYAIGETACTGLHGANRLASNSLLECLVFASQAAKHICSVIDDMPQLSTLPDWDASRVKAASEDVLVNHNWDELRRAMWNYVGIVRNDLRLGRAQKRLEWLSAEVHEYYAHHIIGPDLIELRNLVQVSGLIVECALRRKESRGLHYTLDYPKQLPVAKNTMLRAPL